MKRIPRKKVAALPLRPRVGWGASIVERVLAFYSPYVAERFRLADAVEMAWAFAAGDETSAVRRRALVQELGTFVQVADAERYDGFALIAMGAHLLDEIDHERGEDVVVGVEYAARAYACQRLYRVGRTCADPAIDVDFQDSLEEPVYVAALSALKAAGRSGDAPVTPQTFAEVRLDMPPLDPNAMPGAPGKRAHVARPPSHERQQR